MQHAGTACPYSPTLPPPHPPVLHCAPARYRRTPRTPAAPAPAPGWPAPPRCRTAPRCPAAPHSARSRRRQPVPQQRLLAGSSDSDARLHSATAGFPALALAASMPTTQAPGPMRATAPSPPRTCSSDSEAAYVSPIRSGRMDSVCASLTKQGPSLQATSCSFCAALRAPKVAAAGRGGVPRWGICSASHKAAGSLCVCAARSCQAQARLAGFPHLWSVRLTPRMAASSRSPSTTASHCSARPVTCSRAHHPAQSEVGGTYAPLPLQCASARAACKVSA